MKMVCFKVCSSLILIGSTVASPAAAAGPEPVLADPVLVAPSAPNDWSGGYAGLSFGAAFGRGAVELEDYFGDIFIESDVERGLLPDDIDGSETDFIGGLTIGYNIQREQFLGGVEFDISMLNQEIENTYDRPDPAAPPIEVESTLTTEIDGLATLRLRGGYASGRNLFYATGGLAAGRVKNEYNLDIPGFLPPPDLYSQTWENEDTLFGYAVGAGYERRITERWSLKGEILYYDLEDVTIEARDLGEGLDYEFSNDGYVARVGINLSF